MSPFVEALFRGASFGSQLFDELRQERDIDLVLNERDPSVVMPISQLGCARELVNCVSDSTSNVDLDASNMEIMDTDDLVVPPDPHATITCVLDMSGGFGPAQLHEVCANYGRVKRMYVYRYDIATFVAGVEFEEAWVAAVLLALNGKGIHGITWYSVSAADLDEDVDRAEDFFVMAYPGGYDRLAEFKWKN